MASLEDIVASLTDRLRSLEIENQALQQGIRPENLREPKAALPDKFDGTRRHFRGFINQLELVFPAYRISGTIPTGKKIANLWTLLTDKALILVQSILSKQPERSKYRDQAPRTLDKVSQALCLYTAAEFRQLTADIDWNDAALRSQFYSGLSSEIKDHLVHCESPVSLAAAMDQANSDRQQDF
ncbi:hypothetical protein BASA81_017815 [Batrachochytrium salamandrivorans]|nr:hypothetical protein BASA81_017815 [Batrachochytrium salamandrivorans]